LNIGRISKNLEAICELTSGGLVYKKGLHFLNAIRIVLKPLEYDLILGQMQEKCINKSN